MNPRMVYCQHHVADSLVISLKEVREMIEEISTRELYGIIPFQVHEQFIDSFVSKWESICFENFDQVECILKSLVESLCSNHFGRFQSSGLLYEAKYIHSNVKADR